MIFRRFELNDFDSLIGLLRSTFNGYPEMQYWTWKYSNNPHGFPIIFVAEDKEKIVGCYILNPVRLRIGQELVMGAQSVDAAVDSAYRGGGIFKKLAVGAIAEAAKEDVSIIYAFPNEISYKGQVRIGYRPMFIIPKMYRIFQTSSLLKAKTHVNDSFILKTLGVMDNLQKIRKERVMQSCAKSKNDIKVRVITEFDSRFSDFWKAVYKENNGLLIERDLAYLQWRYMDHPQKNYTTYVCENSKEIIGFIVISVGKDFSKESSTTDRLSMGNIMDLFTLPKMTHAAYPLISAACDKFARDRADIAGCWMPKWYQFHSILQEFGFSDYFELLRRTVTRSKYNSYLIYYINSKETVDEAMRSRLDTGKPCWWYIMLGDSDFA
jgi:hypothetical protein